MNPTSLVIHHTAGAGGNVNTIRQEHKSRGWSDIAYHGVITNGHGGPDGEYQAGRPEARQGAGVYGNNKDRLQVALVGNFEKPHPGFTGPPTPRQLRTLGEWLLERGRKWRIPAAKVQGHREIALPGHATACPGTEMPLGRVRTWYAANLTAGRSQPLDEYLLGAKPFRLLIDGVDVTSAAGATLEDGITRVECALKELCRATGWTLLYSSEQNTTIVKTGVEP